VQTIKEYQSKEIQTKYKHHSSCSSLGSTYVQRREQPLPAPVPKWLAPFNPQTKRGRIQSISRLERLRDNSTNSRKHQIVRTPTLILLWIVANPKFSSRIPHPTYKMADAPAPARGGFGSRGDRGGDRGRGRGRGRGRRGGKSEVRTCSC
jgi:hypothetical protein